MALFLTEEESNFVKMEGGQAFVITILGDGLITMQLLFVTSWATLLKVNIVHIPM